MPTQPTATVKAAIYLRISNDPRNDLLAVDRQREDCLKIAADRGWTVVGEYMDNSISATDKTKIRPAYDRMVNDYAAGQFGAIICWDLDRLTRQPRQLEDWIEAAAERGLLLVTANGDADLSGDGGRMYARIKAAVAKAEIERKSARQKRASTQRAEHGRPPGGRRLIGYTSDGAVIIKEEAKFICQVYERFAAGDTIYSLASWLQTAGLPSRFGEPWGRAAVRLMLSNPRYAGRATYPSRKVDGKRVKGEPVGRPGEWPAIVDETLFDSVQRILADPRRKSNMTGSNARRHIGAGLFICGNPTGTDGEICAATVTTSAGSGYRCSTGDLCRSKPDMIDAHVEGILRTFLARPDLSDVVPVPANSELEAGLHTIRELKVRLAKVKSQWNNDDLELDEYREKKAHIEAEMHNAFLAQNRVQNQQTGNNAMWMVVNTPDPVAAYDAAPLGIRRAVLDGLMTATLLPNPRRLRFTEDSVRIDWKF